MAAWLISAGCCLGDSVDDSRTRYSPACSYLKFLSAEAQAQTKFRDSYTLSKLFVRVIANTLTNAATVRSRKNGANGNQLVSIGAGATGAFTDDVNSDNLASGDYANTQVVTASGGTDITITVVSYKLNSASDVPILVASRWGALFLPSTARYGGLIGATRAHTTETPTQYTFRVGATLSYMRVYVYANSLDDAATVRIRVNGANGNQVVTIGAGLTGEFEDAVNTDNISPGDLVNYQCANAASAGDLEAVMFQVKSSSTGRQTGVAYYNVSDIDSGLTRYDTIEGDTADLSATEADTQSLARADFNGKNLFVRIMTNNLDGATTVRMRKNGVNGNLSVSIGAGATGAFEDTVNTDSFIATDSLNWQVVTGGTDGRIKISIIGFELQQVATPAPSGSSMAAKMIAGKLL